MSCTKTHILHACTYMYYKMCYMVGKGVVIFHCTCTCTCICQCPVVMVFVTCLCTDLLRRSVDVPEKKYLMSRGVVTETQSNMGTYMYVMHCMYNILYTVYNITQCHFITLQHCVYTLCTLHHCLHNTCTMYTCTCTCKCTCTCTCTLCIIIHMVQ